MAYPGEVKASGRERRNLDRSKAMLLQTLHINHTDPHIRESLDLDNLIIDLLDRHEALDREREE